ncbi:unnamed protein product [Anisakis simplex]|uniref:Chitin-binding type-2 domain-containing protein n=1 Tax=Anisakis simplex TaxID=6269 RepID=A0A3P6PXA0_ANISI|nr:unnamed protein product [Anisakis simplex]
MPNSVCVHKISGTYANGCSSEFIVCVDGSATIMRCPATLVYDEKSHLCLEKSNNFSYLINIRLFKKDVEVCGGHTTSLPVTESTTEVAQEETTASSTPQPTPLPGEHQLL